MHDLSTAQEEGMPRLIYTDLSVITTLLMMCVRDVVNVLCNVGQNCLHNGVPDQLPRFLRIIVVRCSASIHKYGLIHWTMIFSDRRALQAPPTLATHFPSHQCYKPSNLSSIRDLVQLHLWIALSRLIWKTLIRMNPD